MLLRTEDISNLNKPVSEINLDKILKRVNYVPEIENKISKETLLKTLNENGYIDLEKIDVDDKKIYQTILPIFYKLLNIDLYANKQVR